MLTKSNKYSLLFLLSLLIASCTPSAVGVGVGGGSHGAGGGVGVTFPMESQNNSYNSTDNTSAGAQPVNHNFGPTYPLPNCKQPEGLPPDRDDPSILRWQYQKQVDDYRDCIQAYIAKAKRDQGIIQERIEQASREYQRFMTFGK